MRRSFWIIQVYYPKSNDKFLIRDTERRGGGSIAKEAGRGVMQSPRASAGSKALILNFWLLKTVRE